MPYVTRHTVLSFYFSLFHSDAVFSVAVAVLPLIKKVIILEEREALGRGRVFILSVFADRAGARERRTIFVVVGQEPSRTEKIVPGTIAILY